MKKVILTVITLCISLLAFSSEVKELRCEMLDDPEGISSIKPRLSWIIESKERNVRQTAYRILAASTLDKLNEKDADLWDSGKVESDQSVLVPYAGAPLVSRSKVYWKVKVYAKKEETLWSSPARFSVGLVNTTDWTAKWIGLDKAFPWDRETQSSRLSARFFRKEFSSQKIVASARVYISGLGLYELYINGEKIGDRVLSPGPTDYFKSVMYNAFDVTSQIRQGRNAIGTILGNGHFYNMRQNYKPHKIKTFGYPKMLLQLEIEYTDGTRQTVVSDNTWKVTSDGPIRSNNDFDGEEYDATKELGKWSESGYDDRKWLKPDMVEAPGGALKAQMNENMRVMQTLKPVKITALVADTFIVDFGQNMAGWVKLTAKGKKGDKITLRFAESLDENGCLKTVNLRSAKATDIYTMKGGDAESWEPRFVTHGFRYMEVAGYPGTPSVADFEGRVVYDDMQTTGSFETSSPVLDQIYKNACWSINGNYKGMPLDCPQRDERQPWLGDHTTGCLGESFIFDNERLYIKWLDDIRDSQTAEGRLPDIAPPYYKIYYSDNMTWPGTYLFVADMIYKQYGNPGPVAEHYPSMKKWFMYMKDRYMAACILTRDKYGDWCVPPESKELIHSGDPARKTDGELIATAYSYKLLELLRKFAAISGNEGDIEEYDVLAENIRKAFNKKFYNAETGQYGNCTVTANLLPLAFGMADEENEETVFRNMLYRIVNKDKLHISTGVIGTQWLMRELAKRGRADVAYAIANQKDYPGWGYMTEQGATTIWELWNGDTASPKMNSHNHVMLLGDLVVWMYEDLAGIKTHKANQGFKWLWMKPNPTEDLSCVEASHKTPYGWVKSGWKLENGIFTWKVTIPANSRANLLLPAANTDDITESGKPVHQVEGLKYVRKEEGRINLEVGSGDYTFVCKYGEAQNRWKEGVMVDEFICQKPPFPESHAPAIAETKEGRLVASWFGGTKERNPDVCIWVSRLIDGKWTAPQNVANGIVNDTLRYAAWNPVLYQVPDGELQLYYKVGPNVGGWTGKMITSDNGGITWSPPRDLPEGFIGPAKNKPVLLKDGTLLCPSSAEGNGWKVHLEVTEDFGKTWKKTGPVNEENGIHAIQPAVLTYKDGSLQMLCRTQERAIGESWSYDNGKTWTPVAKTLLPNNNSGIDAVTLQDGRQLLVYNHVLPNDTLKKGKGARTPLNVAVSEDGKTWHAALVLEDSPISQYSYPSVIQARDGMVHVVYTWRRKSVKHVVIDPDKLALSKIGNMKWPSIKETEEVQVVNDNRYKVSVCDWMMLKRQKIGAIELAREIGADGLELDMGGLGKRISFDNKLTEKHFQKLFISECNRLGIRFSSIAMSAFYGQSFARRENYERLIDECIATMKALGVKVAFLPMGNQSDPVKEPELYPVVLERLKVVAKKAEAAGMIIGIETTLTAKEEARLVDRINSPGIRSYVNFSSILKRGGNIVKELNTLGKDRIVQIHASNTDGFWLENDPAVDMLEIRKTLDKMGWSGWLVVERSRDVKDVHNVKKNYGANVRYLKSVFQK
ncbi:MAG: family 78 glycoside hydrolase catalytic domain [Prevotella sp.]|jgi:alpha-L-rhamnosidase|nr:family 78 glycoside hydrolase catalytic domain [Prevotella sp.]